MSFLKRLFGAGGAGSAPAAEIVHDGYRIAATPQKEGDQFRLHGTISKEVDGEMKTHILIRADLFPAAEDCVAQTFVKAKQVIKERGAAIFG